MNPQQLQEIEQTIQQALTCVNNEQRKAAEKQLEVFATADSLSVCQSILNHSQNPYALIFAFRNITKLITDHWHRFNEQVPDLLNYVLRALATQGLNLPRAVLMEQVQLACRMVKLGWKEIKECKNMPTNVLELATASPNHRLLSLEIFQDLVTEINQLSPNRTLSQHRKVAIDFRDKALLKIFELALNGLRDVAGANMGGEQVEKLKERSVKLALQCLTFDFLGIDSDESSDDVSIVHVPSTWRSFIEDGSIVYLFFQIYASSAPPVSVEALSSLVQLASVRRSLFSDSRVQNSFLEIIMNNMVNVLRNGTGLKEQENHHQFCRLLARLKQNFQLTQIVNAECYSEWINLVCDFTVQSFRLQDWGQNSSFYLLSAWARLLSARSYLKGSKPSMLENYAPQIIQAYTAARIDAVPALLSQPDHDITSNDEVLQTHLNLMPQLGRCDFPKTAMYLMSVFGPLASKLEQLTAQQEGVLDPHLQIVEAQLAWVVYIIGAIVVGRFVSSSQENDKLDGELTSNVIQLMKIHDRRLERFQGMTFPKTTELLELSILYFFQGFRRVYIGDQAMSSSKVYKRMSELIGIEDSLSLLGLIINKIGSNLKFWAQSKIVINTTLDLFSSIAYGYSTNKLLQKLQVTQQILSHHTSQYFPFLAAQNNTKSRTEFYKILAQQLFSNQNISRFSSFMEPFAQCFVKLLPIQNVEALRQPDVKEAIIGLMRDLRGVVDACTSKLAYNTFFDWIFPNYTPFLSRAAEAWYDDPEVMFPVLKFMLGFVSNESGGRIKFHISSPNGILLFRVTSNFIVTYGSRLLTVTCEERDLYKRKYKGILLSLDIMTSALSGGYVNFGVFELYNDPALSTALDIALKLALSVPVQELMVFPNLAQSYFTFIQTMCINHNDVIIKLDAPIFSQIVATLQQGVQSELPNVSSKSCTALQHLLDFTQCNSKTKAQIQAQFQAHVQSCPNLFPYFMLVLFKRLLFDDRSAIWTMSRPIFALVCYFPEAFEAVQRECIGSQPPDKQQAISEAFEKLKTGVVCEMTPKNRDKFSENLNFFRHEVSDLITKPLCVFPGGGSAGGTNAAMNSSNSSAANSNAMMS